MKIIAHIIYWIGIACAVALWATVALLLCVVAYCAFEVFTWEKVRFSLKIILGVITIFGGCCLWQWAADRRKE